MPTTEDSGLNVIRASFCEDVTMPASAVRNVHSQGVLIHSNGMQVSPAIRPTRGDSYTFDHSVLSSHAPPWNVHLKEVLGDALSCRDQQVLVSRLQGGGSSFKIHKDDSTQIQSRQSPDTHRVNIASVGFIVKKFEFPVAQPPYKSPWWDSLYNRTLSSYTDSCFTLASDFATHTVDQVLGQTFNPVFDCEHSYYCIHMSLTKCKKDCVESLHRAPKGLCGQNRAHFDMYMNYDALHCSGTYGDGHIRGLNCKSMGFLGCANVCGSVLFSTCPVRLEPQTNTVDGWFCPFMYDVGILDINKARFGVIYENFKAFYKSYKCFSMSNAKSTKLWDFNVKNLLCQLHSSENTDHICGQPTWFLGPAKGSAGTCLRSGGYSLYSKRSSAICTAIHTSNAVSCDVTHAAGIQSMFTCTENLGQYTHALHKVITGAWQYCWLFGCPGPPVQGHNFKGSTGNLSAL